MTKQVNDISKIDILGKSLEDLAEEIYQGRNDAVAGVLKMAHAYDEALRRFPTSAEKFFKTNPKTRWMSKATRDLLRMVANADLDPRVVLIPEPNLVGFIKVIPFKQQKKLLDDNPYVTVIDPATGKGQNVAYIDITPRQTKIAYDPVQQRFRTLAEQQTYLVTENVRAKKREESWKPYTRVGNMVRFERCEIGRNELASLLREMGFTVEER